MLYVGVYKQIHFYKPESVGVYLVVSKNITIFCFEIKPIWMWRQMLVMCVLWKRSLLYITTRKRMSVTYVFSSFSRISLSRMSEDDFKSEHHNLSKDVTFMFFLLLVTCLIWTSNLGVRQVNDWSYMFSMVLHMHPMSTWSSHLNLLWKWNRTYKTIYQIVDDDVIDN